MDALFFGNDFGSQLDLLISPDAFTEFVFPYFRQFTDLGHQHGLQVILHSCGSIKKVIPNLMVSPSHEAVLPNVPPENLEAMAEAALE